MHTEKTTTKSTGKSEILPNSKSAPKQVNFGCPECDKQFRTLGEIEKHSLIHLKQNNITVTK